jgi:site-specific DNA-cytosine methylase
VPALTMLDLFSCVGAHALGAEAAGWRVVQMCESVAFRREILAELFPRTPIADDINTMRCASALAAFGGPPCQKTSRAASINGGRTGSSLWPAMRERVHEAGCDWVIVEQPTGNAEWEAGVQKDLASDRFFVARFEYGASDVGAPYPRRRVYIVACTSRERLALARQALPSEIVRVARAANAGTAWCPDQLASLPVVARDAGEMDRGDEGRRRKALIEALGDSNPPQMAEAVCAAVATAAR